MIQFFSKDASSDGAVSTELLGGKGINLCKLSRAKFSVPQGFVITTPAYRAFVEAGGLAARIEAALAPVRSHEPAAVEAASAEIRGTFENQEIPETLAQQVLAAYEQLQTLAGEPNLSVAVRSSATAEDLAEAAFAGQQDTYLNIRGPQAVLKAVRACWSSLWTARAITYRAHHGFDKGDLALAVVVQRLVPAEAAGVAFTANPVTGARDEVVMNAAWGLGEAIVGGQVTPDSIVVDKATGRIKDLAIAEKAVMTVRTETGTEEREIADERRHARVLDDGHVAALARLAVEVEQYYGKPQDLEWCLAGGELFLLQSRPITALPPDPAVQTAYREQEIARLRTIAGGKEKVWVVHNLAETLIAPTPLTWDIVRDFMRGDGGYGRMYVDFGYRPSKRVRDEGFLELICGRIFTDPDRAAEQFWESMPFKYDHDEILKDPRILEAAPAKFDADGADEKFLLRLPGTLWAMFRSSRLTKQARREAIRVFREQVLPPYRAYLAEKRQQDLTRLTTPQLLDELHDRVGRILTDFGRESLKPGFFGGCARAELEKLLIQLLGPQEGARLCQVLTSGLDGDSTMEQNVMLFRVAVHRHSGSPGDGATLEAFLERYGHRAVAEMELAVPRWREDPSYIDEIVERQDVGQEHSPEHLHKANQEKRLQAVKDLPELLKTWGGSSLREEIEQLAAEAQALLPYREIGKHYLMMGYEEIRRTLLEFGRRFKLGDDLFFLRSAELAEFEKEPAKYAALAEKRKVEWQCAQKLDLPDVINSAEIDALGLPRTFAAASRMPAVPLSAGVVVGTARVVFNPADAKDLGSDAVLVCPSTDPSWTALFTTIKGLVVERGGVLSHGAITARDFSIPAVACPNATQIIKHGTKVRVDGDRGQITIIED